MEVSAWERASRIWDTLARCYVSLFVELLACPDDQVDLEHRTSNIHTRMELYNAKLDPPVGTCYFKSYKFSLSGEWKPPFPFPINMSFSANMEVTFYIYVTLVKPTDPDFTAKGGKVYIVAVYNGSATSNDLDFGVEDLSGALSAVDQLPVPGTDERRGDTSVYTIDFAQNMSMYNNSGNSGYTFPAQYQRIFGLTGYSQSKYHTNNWSLKYDGFARTHEHPVLNGLQVFETNRLTKAKIKVFFIFRSYIGQTFSKEFEIDFSAQTMAQAVVG